MILPQSTEAIPHDSSELVVKAWFRHRRSREAAISDCIPIRKEGRHHE